MAWARLFGKVTYYNRRNKKILYDDEAMNDLSIIQKYIYKEVQKRKKSKHVFTSDYGSPKYYHDTFYTGRKRIDGIDVLSMKNNRMQINLLYRTKTVATTVIHLNRIKYHYSIITKPHISNVYRLLRLFKDQGLPQEMLVYVFKVYFDCRCDSYVTKLNLNK